MEGMTAKEEHHKNLLRELVSKISFSNDDSKGGEEKYESVPARTPASLSNLASQLTQDDDEDIPLNKFEDGVDSISDIGEEDDDNSHTEEAQPLESDTIFREKEEVTEATRSPTGSTCGSENDAGQLRLMEDEEKSDSQHSTRSTDINIHSSLLNAATADILMLDEKSLLVHTLWNCESGDPVLQEGLGSNISEPYHTPREQTIDESMSTPALFFPEKTPSEVEQTTENQANVKEDIPYSANDTQEESPAIKVTPVADFQTFNEATTDGAVSTVEPNTDNVVSGKASLLKAGPLSCCDRAVLQQTDTDLDPSPVCPPVPQGVNESFGEAKKNFIGDGNEDSMSIADETNNESISSHGLNGNQVNSSLLVEDSLSPLITCCRDLGAQAEPNQYSPDNACNHASAANVGDSLTASSPLSPAKQTALPIGKMEPSTSSTGSSVSASSRSRARNGSDISTESLDLRSEGSDKKLEVEVVVDQESPLAMRHDEQISGNDQQRSSQMVATPAHSSAVSEMTMSITSAKPSDRGIPTPVFGQSRDTSSTLSQERRALSQIVMFDLWSPDERVVESGLNQLTMDASRDPEARSTIARTGGILSIVRCMHTHKESSAIQIAACRTLEKLALDTDNEMAISEVGGISAVYGAMMGHFDCSDVQEAAWSALWNLSCLDIGNNPMIDHAEGVSAVVSAMKRHMDEPKVQKNACGALTNLCLNNETRLEALVKSGGIVAIASALETHWNDPGVRDEASHALTQLLAASSSAYEIEIEEPRS